MEKKDKVIYIFSPYGITIYRSYKEWRFNFRS